MNCLICKKNDNVNFLSDFRLEIREDEKYFRDAKIFRCSACDFSFVSPMPSTEKLDYFMKNFTDQMPEQLF